MHTVICTPLYGHIIQQPTTIPTLYMYIHVSSSGTPVDTKFTVASFPGLHNLRGWETKAWYTLFAHAPDSVFLLRHKYSSAMVQLIALQLSPSEVPSFTECVSYTWNTACDWHCSKSRASIFDKCCKWLYYLSTDWVRKQSVPLVLQPLMCERADSLDVNCDIPVDLANSRTCESYNSVLAEAAVRVAKKGVHIVQQTTWHHFWKLYVKFSHMREQCVPGLRFSPTQIRRLGY